MAIKSLILPKAVAAYGVQSEAPFLPPSNYGVVMPGVFRSALPKPENFGFLETLGLRSIVYLCPEPYPEENMEFVRSKGIQLLQFGIEGGKVSIPKDTIMKALVVLLASKNHPVLIHCKSGKHRTGCLVGCMRKLYDWDLADVHKEYHQYADPKSRDSDLKFIEEFNIFSFERHLLDLMFQSQNLATQAKGLSYQDDS